MDWKKTLLICLIILLAGGAATVVIFSSEPEARLSGATKETAMLVDITKVEKGTFRPTIQVMGTVIPSQDIQLSPRVNGEILERSESFVPGGHVQKGEKLLQIDPADYKNALQQQKSELQQVMAEYKIEMGRQEAAQKEYQLYGDTLSEEGEALVLRRPQLEAVKSQIEFAKAAVEQAKLDLERTTLRAPFDAHIISRNVNVGSQVAAGDNLGRLVGVEAYWVEATVPQSKLRWLNFPDENEQGSQVKIRNRTAWEERSYRTGYLDQLVGTLENQSRMARVLITVPDPLGFGAETDDIPPLMIGSFVETHIKAKELTGVVRISRDYIRQSETVWTMQGDSLQINDVNIAFQDAQYAYISEGLEAGDQVVTTNLSTVTEGARLRVKSFGAKKDTVSEAME